MRWGIKGEGGATPPSSYGVRPFKGGILALRATFRLCSPRRAPRPVRVRCGRGAHCGHIWAPSGDSCNHQ